MTVFCLLVIAPPSANAATGMAEININTLGGANADNTAAVVTESQWTYSDMFKTLSFLTPGGNYTLKGSNSDIVIWSNANDANVTLDGVNITSPIIAMYVNENTTITLTNSNNVTSNGALTVAINVDSSKSLTINGTGTLTVGSANDAIHGVSNNTLTIGGTATVNANATMGAGVHMTGNAVVNVAAGAKLNATGVSMGYLNDPGGSTKIKCDGSATFEGAPGWGIYSRGPTTIEGSGKVTAIGVGSWAIEGNDIRVGDKVTLEMRNNSAGDETHTFQKASAANTHQWKLTNASLTGGNVKDATIGVIVAGGATGTIQRVPIPVTTTDVTFTAEQTGGTSGTTSSTGIVLTFSQPVTGLAAPNVTITNGTGSATKGLVTGSGTTWTVAISAVTQGNVTVAISNFGSFNVTGGAKTVAVYSASTVYDVKDGADGNWVKGTSNGHAITVGAPSSKVTGVNVDGNPVDAGNYTVANNADGDAVVTFKAAFLETLDLGSHSLKIFMNDGSASTALTVTAAGDAEEGGGGSNSMLIVAVVIIAILAIAVIAYMFVIKPKMK